MIPGINNPYLKTHRQGPLSGPGFGNCHQNPTAVKVMAEFKAWSISAQVLQAFRWDFLGATKHK